MGGKKLPLQKQEVGEEVCFHGDLHRCLVLTVETIMVSWKVATLVLGQPNFFVILYFIFNIRG